MSKIASPYKCDVCGAAKGEGNKWLLGLPMVNGYPVGGYIIRSAYLLMDWNDDIADDTVIHHLCSEKCALTKQAEYIRRT